RKAVRLKKSITAKTPVTRKFTVDRALVDTDSNGNSRLLHPSFIKSVNLASLVSGQMVLSC
ncbi:MAG: hypothetical protein ACKVG1_13300, partial [Rhodospirillales bacterium]